jgi:hypothetical protein
MQITHEEARRLIQFKADSGLNLLNEEKLSTHLRTCEGCRAYADATGETELVLQQTMHRRWDIPPLPLRLDVILGKVNSRWNDRLVTTRKALIGVALVLFAFMTWQSVTTNHSAILDTPPGALPMIPTPSTQYTVTNATQKDCREIKYIEQEGDTLESIAKYLSVSKESILLANNLSDETPVPGRELVIRFCGPTPAGTTHTPTITITPILETVVITPG